VRRFLIPFLVVVAIGGLAGCGDDDSSTATDKVTTTVEGGDTDTTKVDFSGKGSGDFCKLFRDYTAKAATSPDLTSKEAVKTQFEGLGTAVDELEKQAPAEIKADVKITATAFGKLIAALAAVDYDFTKVDQAAVSDISSPDVQAAGERLQQYSTDVCGIAPVTTNP
jgi:hypothetical protein